MFQFDQCPIGIFEAIRFDRGGDGNAGGQREELADVVLRDVGDESWLCRAPAFVANQRYKRKRAQIVDRQRAVLVAKAVQMLARFALSDRHHDASALGKLIGVRGRQTGSACGHDNHIEWRFLDKTKRTVTKVNMNIAEAQSRQCGQRSAGKGRDAFDRVDYGTELREHSSPISRASADFENLFVTSQLGRFGHERYRIRLRDCLFSTDR